MIISCKPNHQEFEAPADNPPFSRQPALYANRKFWVKMQSNARESTTDETLGLLSLII